MSLSKAGFRFGLGALLSVLCPIFVLAQPTARSTEIGVALGVIALIVVSAAFASFVKRERREHEGADSHSGA